MKLYVSNSEIRIIIDGLYKYKSSLQSDLASKEASQKIIEICEERIAEIEKLICYFKDKVSE